MTYIVDVVTKSDPDAPVRNLGKFATLEEATAAAQRVVDETLKDIYQPGLTAKDLFQRFMETGVVPYIFLDDDPNTFNQRTFNHHQYALQRCAALCGGAKPS